MPHQDQNLILVQVARIVGTQVTVQITVGGAVNQNVLNVDISDISKKTVKINVKVKALKEKVKRSPKRMN